MLPRSLICCLIAVAIVTVAHSDEGKKEKKEKVDEYIKIEVRGRLTDGVVAIGGETTGTTITAKGVTFEIEVGEDENLRELVKKMSGRTVVVVGTLERRRGIEIPVRWIITVRDLRLSVPTQE